MKRIAPIIIFVLVLSLTACRLELPEVTTENYTDEASAELTENQTDISMETTAHYSVEESTSEEHTSIVADPHLTTETTTRSQSEVQTTEFYEVPSDFEDVISMPEKNGTMVTDKSPDNKFIKIVCKERKIDAELLVAVYSVPESGQNYVFEFRNETDREDDELRRVYLINEKGKITSVAAADGKEKENISSIENWFSMNVLIKEVIFPAIEKDLR